MTTLDFLMHRGKVGPKPFLWKNQKGNDLRDFTCGTISHQNRLLDFWSKHEEEQKWNNIAAMEITPVQPMKWNGLIFHQAGYLEPHESRNKRGRKEFYSCQNFTSTTVLCFSLTCSINILPQLSKFIRSLRLVKSLSNWKPVTNTYHRGLDFFQIPLNGMHYPESRGRTDFPLLQLWVCREQRTMPSTYELHLVSTQGSWPQTWSFHRSHTWEAQLGGWGGGSGWWCFVPETPVSWILCTCIRFYKVEKVLFSGLLTSSQCIWGKTVHWL